MDQISETGVIPGHVYNQSNLIRKAAYEIIEGKIGPYSAEEIEKFVDLRYFGFVPLVRLEDHEESLLRRGMIDSLLKRLNNGQIRQFYGSDCYLETSRFKKTLRPHIYAKNALTLSRYIHTVRLTTEKEKLGFLENPENLNARWHTRNIETSFARMGYRHIDEYSIKCAKNFTAIIRRLQASNRRKEQHILDLGGGVGLALNDLKSMHPELVTYNATRDEEFSHYPNDYQVIGFMERMPLALEGRIDLILSNMATRYFTYCDRVIEGCIRMLARGGILDVFFSSERSSNPSRDDVKLRMKKAYDFLKGLERQGTIKLKIISSFTSNFGGTFKSYKRSLYPAARVIAKKII